MAYKDKLKRWLRNVREYSGLHCIMLSPGDYIRSASTSMEGWVNNVRIPPNLFCFSFLWELQKSRDTAKQIKLIYCKILEIIFDILCCGHSEQVCEIFFDAFKIFFFLWINWTSIWVNMFFLLKQACSKQSAHVLQFCFVFKRICY